MFKNISKVSVLATLVLFFMSGCSYKKIVSSNSQNDELTKEYSKVQQQNNI